MSSEQLSEGEISSVINPEKAEKNNDEAGGVDIEQMMTRVFAGGEEKKEKIIKEELDESSLPIELIANPKETEKPPEEEDDRSRKIREAGPIVRSRIDAGSPTAEKPPIYEVTTAETPIVADTTVAVNRDELEFNLRPENGLPVMKKEQIKESEALEVKDEVKEPELKNPYQSEKTSKAEAIVEESPEAEELAVEEKNKFSERQAARAQLLGLGKLQTVDFDLVRAQDERTRFEQFENRSAA